MALRCVKLFVASWLLLGCVGNPIFKVDLDKCINFSKELLDSVNATLSSEEINEGFNCTSELMNDITKATTVTACEPDYSSKMTGCTRQRETAFDQDTCLRNITEDLLQYKAEFSKYQLSEHLDKTLSTIDALIEVLSSPDRKATFRQKTELTFPARMKLCEILQAFRVRTVTINRVMNYIKSRVSR
ncbi:interleukin-12 subunit alpha-like [Huso huso]|uniref:Interleukin-12 subunit alpha n=1 Tax=Huso huso TaxID=61971 RepID=A0ABR0ZGA5_HUSHU